MSEKQDLDLDFDDIVGKKAQAQTAETETQAQTVKQEEIKEKPPEKKALSTYGLAYPVGNGKFKQIELSTATNEEFLEWVNYLFPKSGRQPSDFASYDVRVRVLKNIIKAHQSLPWLHSQERIDPGKKKKEN